MSSKRIQQDDTPTVLRQLGDGTAEIGYRAFPGDRTVIAFLPGQTARLIAEVTKIGGSPEPAVIELVDDDYAHRFAPYTNEMRAAAVEFYFEVTPARVSFHTGSV